MRVPGRFFYSLLFVFLCLEFSTEAFSQERVAGVIQEIRGAVYWRKNSRAKRDKLDPRLDLARILYVGEEVRPGRGGSVRLILCSGEKGIPPPLNWFRISVSDECTNQSALEAYGRLGGSDRGDTKIFSPAAHSVIVPDMFVIRWIPSAAGCKVNLTIKNSAGKAIWDEDGIDGSPGVWDSPKTRQVIKEYQTKADTVPLRLELNDSCGKRAEITFSLLSENSEAALKMDLEQWEKNNTKLMTHLGRAYVFESYRMLSEIAEEYEAALRIAPESRELLRRTILAHQETGNLLREEELKKRSESKSPSP